MKARCLATSALLALAASPAAAHGGHDHGPRWTLDPAITIPLALSALIFVIGFVRLRARSGRGWGAMKRQAWLYGAGWVVLAATLVSPLHEAGERSFTMHMIEHELLMLVAAFLLVAARPGPMLLWGLPRPLRYAAGGAARWPFWGQITRPVIATAIQALAIWLWHAPALFDLALVNAGWHVAQHLSFIVSALLFWWSMLYRSSETLAALCLFITSMIGGALGALMALSESPWYAEYAGMGLTPEGLSPTQDQQLAGLIMWVPGGLFHLAAALVFLGRWLRHKDTHDALASG